MLDAMAAYCFENGLELRGDQANQIIASILGCIREKGLNLAAAEMLLDEAKKDLKDFAEV